MKTVKTEDMNWVDIKEKINHGFKTILVAVGSIEQHGPHLPTKTDAKIGDALVTKIVEKLPKALQAPTIHVGCSDHHMAFPGTISVRDETLQALMFDYTSSLVTHGFETIIFVPSHGGNFKPIAKIIEKLQPDFHEVNILAYTELMPFLTKLNKLSLQEGVSAEEAGAHAGESEASIMLYLEEELVKKERFTAGYVGVFGEKESLRVIKNGLQELTEIGILGDPRKASKEKGEKYIEQLADFLATEIKQMLK